MQGGSGGLLSALAIDRVGAAVSLDATGGRHVPRDPASLGSAREAAERDAEDGRLHVHATLFAEDRSGWRISSGRPDMGVTCRRAGAEAIWKRHPGPSLSDDRREDLGALDDYRLRTEDIEDAINQLLGRDPEQRRPPRLSWAPLISELAREGYHVGEPDLIAAPFVFEFSSELLAEIQRS